MKIKYKSSLSKAVWGVFFILILSGSLFSVGLKVNPGAVPSRDLGNFSPGERKYWALADTGGLSIAVNNSGSDQSYVIKIKNNNPESKALYLESNPNIYLEWRDDNPCFIALARIWDAPDHLIFSRDINLKPGVENNAYEGHPHENITLKIFFNLFVPFKAKGLGGGVVPWTSAFGRYKADLIISVI